jgi:hypothetical protein
MTRQFSKSAADKEVVCEGDSVSGGNLKNLMLTVAEERRPLDVLGRVRPIEGDEMALVTNEKLTTLVRTWKTNNERAEL